MYHIVQILELIFRFCHSKFDIINVVKILISFHCSLIFDK